MNSLIYGLVKIYLYINYKDIIKLVFLFYKKFSNLSSFSFINSLVPSFFKIIVKIFFNLFFLSSILSLIKSGKIFLIISNSFILASIFLLFCLLIFLFISILFFFFSFFFINFNLLFFFLYIFFFF